MDLFGMDDEKLQATYHRAMIEANRGFVDPRKYPYLDNALFLYAKEHGWICVIVAVLFIISWFSG